MGANGSYNKEYGGVPLYARTHTDTGYRVDGHKVLLQKGKEKQSKMPLNSNSEHPIYLVAKLKDGKVKIQGIGVYENHKLVATIDLKFDADGNLIPFGTKDGSHLHKWEEGKDGDMGRDSHNPNNIYPIPSEYMELIKQIVKFNQSNKTWKKD